MARPARATTGPSRDAAVTEALFVRHDDALVPTELSRGPWSPDALHGGPVAAVVARAVENLDPDPAMHVARLTVELLRPVPLAPLEITATVFRPGRKVQVVDVTITAAGTAVAAARAVRIRSLPDTPADSPLHATASVDTPPPGPDTGARSSAFNEGGIGFANGGTDLRIVEGTVGSSGPATVWVRLAVPVVDGEVPTPLQRAAAAADFGNGFSSVLDFQRFIFINPDLTVYVTRPVVGEWVCVQSVTTLGPPGTATAEARLWDESGPVGRSLQSLFVDHRA